MAQRLGQTRLGLVRLTKIDKRIGMVLHREQQYVDSIQALRDLGCLTRELDSPSRVASIPGCGRGIVQRDCGAELVPRFLERRHRFGEQALGRREISLLGRHGAAVLHEDAAHPRRVRVRQRPNRQRLAGLELTAELVDTHLDVNCLRHYVVAAGRVAQTCGLTGLPSCLAPIVHRAVYTGEAQVRLRLLEDVRARGQSGSVGRDCLRRNAGLLVRQAGVEMGASG